MSTAPHLESKAFDLRKSQIQLLDGDIKEATKNHEHQTVQMLTVQMLEMQIDLYNITLAQIRSVQNQLGKACSRNGVWLRSPRLNGISSRKLQTGARRARLTGRRNRARQI